MEIAPRIESSKTSKSIIYGNNYVLIHKSLIFKTLESYYTNNKIKTATPRGLFYLLRIADFDTFNSDINSRSNYNNISLQSISNDIFGTERSFNDAIISLQSTRIIGQEESDYILSPIDNAVTIDIEYDFRNAESFSYNNAVCQNEFRANLFLEMARDDLINFPDNDIEKWNKILNNRVKSYIHDNDLVYLNEIFSDIPTTHILIRALENNNNERDDIHYKASFSFIREDGVIIDIEFYSDYINKWIDDIEIGDVTQGQEYVMVRKSFFRHLLEFHYPAKQTDKIKKSNGANKDKWKHYINTAKTISELINIFNIVTHMSYADLPGIKLTKLEVLFLNMSIESIVENIDSFEEEIMKLGEKEGNVFFDSLNDEYSIFAISLFGSAVLGLDSTEINELISQFNKRNTDCLLKIFFMYIGFIYLFKIIEDKGEQVLSNKEYYDENLFLFINKIDKSKKNKPIDLLHNFSLNISYESVCNDVEWYSTNILNIPIEEGKKLTELFHDDSFYINDDNIKISDLKELLIKCIEFQKLTLTKEESMTILWALQFADSYNFKKGKALELAWKNQRSKNSKGLTPVVKKGIIESEGSGKNKKYKFPFYSNKLDSFSHLTLTDKTDRKRINNKTKNYDKSLNNKAKEIYELYLKMSKNSFFSDLEKTLPGSISEIIAIEYETYGFKIRNILENFMKDHHQ